MAARKKLSIIGHNVEELEYTDLLTSGATGYHRTASDISHAGDVGHKAVNWSGDTRCLNIHKVQTLSDCAGAV